MKRYIITCIAALMGMLCAQAESISIEDVVMNPGETKSIAISLTNSNTNLVSFQMDLYLPDGITINKSGCSLSSRFENGQELTIGKQADGVYRLTSTSFALTPISGTSGTIINLSLTASATAVTGSASIKDILFVDRNSESVVISDKTFQIRVRENQSLSLATLPSQTYGSSYTLPSQTDQGLALTWTVANSSVATVSGNVLTAKGVGSTTVTATQAGNSSYLPFTKTYTLTVTAKSASNLAISSIAAQTYSGSAKTPTVTVKDGSTTLTSGTHYTVAYSNNTNAGTATVTITGMGNYTGTKNANFTINPKNASNLTINSIAAQTYSGSAKTPTVTVKDGTTTLTSGTHYTVSYSNNTNAGTATATITGKGNYTGTKSANFTINKVAASVTTAPTAKALTYTGEAQQLVNAGVASGGTMQYSRNGSTYSTSIPTGTEPGSYTVYYKVVGDDNHNDTNAGTVNVTINRAPLTITAKNQSITYGGSISTGIDQVTISGLLGQDQLYNFSLYPSTSNVTTSGTITVTVYSIRDRWNEPVTSFYDITCIPGTLTINAKSASNLTIDDIAAVTYNGSAQTPTVTVKDGTTTLTSGTHYTVSYSNNTNAGTATATITGMGNYTGTKSANFTINKASSAVTTAPTAKALTYTGEAQQLVNAGVASGGTMQYSLDGTTYSTSIPTGTNAGSYTVYYKVVGDANHGNSEPATVNVTIEGKSASNFTIDPVAAVTYNGSAQTPAVTVKDGTTTLTSGTDYTVSYSNNTNAGTATLTVTGSGNYSGTKEAEFTINKASLTATAKSYTINKGAQLPTYECIYSGFMGGDDETAITTQPTFSCPATDSNTPGSYTITPSDADAMNYTFNYVAGTLTINANFLQPNNTVGCRGGQGTLVVSMNNTENIVGFQFDLQLPEGVSLATNSNETYAASLTSRKANHSLSVNKVGDNLYRFVSVSMNNTPFTGTEGALVNAKLRIDENIALGNYEANVKDIEMTVSNMSVINVIPSTATLTIQDAEPGDMNGDTKISVTDVSCIIGYILNDAPPIFIESAADLNNDNKISVTDAVIVIDMILNEGSSAPARQFNETEVEPQ